MLRRALPWLVALALAIVPARAPAATVIGTLSNFDVHNFTDEPANDFHLLFAGMSCADLLGVYVPFPWSWQCEDLPDGTIHLWWTDELEPVPPCTMVHFGFEVPGNPPLRAIAAWWTRDGRPLRPYLSFVNQRWEGSAECWVGDLVDGYPPLNRPDVLIQRDFALSSFEIPLEQLTWDETGWLPWEPGTGLEPVPADPGFMSPLPIPVPGPVPAVLVRYPVFGDDPATPDARVLNELLLNPVGLPERSFVNLDIRNRTALCVDDLHLELRGVSCSDLLQFYVPPGWAVVCEDLPDGSGCALTWTSVDGTCLMPGDLLHVGFGFFGTPDWRVRAAWWTWHGVPIPPFVDFPPQTWWVEGFLPIDVVWGYEPSLVSGPVWLQREFALPGVVVPLPELTWVGTDPFDWLIADDGPIAVPPDPAFTNEFIVPAALTHDQPALLFRYQTWDNHENLQIRFTNEALLETLAPPPPVENLRIFRVGDTPPDLLHLRLEWEYVSPVPVVFHVWELPEPYDPDLRLPIGDTVDSFFDVFYVLPDVERFHGWFMVTVETLPF